MIKKILATFTALIMMFGTPVSVMAQEIGNSSDLTPIEIDELLKDVEPIEVCPGVYLREMGEISIYDIDVSQFTTQEIPESVNEGEMIPQMALQSWDLNTSAYSGSFQAVYRVFTSVDFVGYTDLYVQYSNVNCPSGSQWKSTIYDGWTEIAASDWLSSSKTSYTSHFYNLDTSVSYQPAFVKTNNGDLATGDIKVYLN